LRALVLASHNFRIEFAASLDLNITDSVALSHLAADGPITAGELAHRAGLAPSSVTAMLDRLERAGLASRTVRPEDRRAVTIALTEQGRQAIAIGNRWTSAAISALDTDNLAYITGQLQALADALTDESHCFAAAADLDSRTSALAEATSVAD
jgi:DNA-binding MarR family transcriptional regulator